MVKSSFYAGVNTSLPPGCAKIFIDRDMYNCHVVVLAEDDQGREYKEYFSFEVWDDLRHYFSLFSGKGYAWPDMTQYIWDFLVWDSCGGIYPARYALLGGAKNGENIVFAGGSSLTMIQPVEPFELGLPSLSESTPDAKVVRTSYYLQSIAFGKARLIPVKVRVLVHESVPESKQVDFFLDLLKEFHDLLSIPEYSILRYYL